MNKIVSLGLFLLITFSIVSCELDEGKLPNIKLKTGTEYTSKDDTLAANSTYKFGIEASKSENRDVLKKFNYSVSKNGAAPESIENKDLSGSEGDNFSIDFTKTVDTTKGYSIKHILTVTNRDGLSNSVSLTIVSK